MGRAVGHPGRGGRRRGLLVARVVGYCKWLGLAWLGFVGWMAHQRAIRLYYTTGREGHSRPRWVRTRGHVNGCARSALGYSSRMRKRKVFKARRQSQRRKAAGQDGI